MKKSRLILIGLLLALLLAIGCSEKVQTDDKPNLPPSTNQVQKDTGAYVGQIDNNSIEIKLSGVPEKNAARAFQLADKVKDNFEHFGLETGDQVFFSYFKNNNNQLVLTSIEKIRN